MEVNGVTLKMILGMVTTLVPIDAVPRIFPERLGLTMLAALQPFMRINADIVETGDTTPTMASLVVQDLELVLQTHRLRDFM